MKKEKRKIRKTFTPAIIINLYKPIASMKRITIDSQV